MAKGKPLRMIFVVSRCSLTDWSKLLTSNKMNNVSTSITNNTNNQHHLNYFIRTCCWNSSNSRSMTTSNSYFVNQMSILIRIVVHMSISLRYKLLYTIGNKLIQFIFCLVRKQPVTNRHLEHFLANAFNKSLSGLTYYIDYNVWYDADQ